MPTTSSTCGCKRASEQWLKAFSGRRLRAPGPSRQAGVGDLEREVIATDPFVLAVRPEHPLGRASSAVQASDLRDVEVLLLDDGHCFRDQALEVCSTLRAREGEFRATSLTTLIQMVVGGAGVTLLPALSVAAETKRARLRIRPLASAKAHRTIALVWRKQTPLAPALREVASILRLTCPCPPIGRQPHSHSASRSAKGR